MKRVQFLVLMTSVSQICPTLNHAGLELMNSLLDTVPGKSSKKVLFQ